MGLSFILFGHIRWKRAPRLALGKQQKEKVTKTELSYCRVQTAMGAITVKIPNMEKLQNGPKNINFNQVERSICLDSEPAIHQTPLNPTCHMRRPAANPPHPLQP